MQKNESKMRALHVIQKIMSRPDSAEVFQRFDVDGDGTVERSELAQGLKQIGEKVSDGDLDAMMELMDVDGDGTIDYRCEQPANQPTALGLSAAMRPSRFGNRSHPTQLWIGAHRRLYLCLGAGSL